jgi:hypothetical protein
MLPVDRGCAAASDSAAAMLGSDVKEVWSSDSNVGKAGRIAVLVTGAGAYTITESGVSVLTSTGRRRSCSIGSGMSSSTFPSLIDARLFRSRRQTGDNGGKSFDSGSGEEQPRRLLSDLWLLTLLRLDDVA